jgi:Zn-finger protein
MKASYFNGREIYAEHIQEAMKRWASQRDMQIRQVLADSGLVLKEENIGRILQATSFDMLTWDARYKSHCTFYGTSRSCHPDMRNLSCFLCACPHYDHDFIENNKDKTLVGRCRINEKGKYHVSERIPVGVWDCSHCTLTHEEGYVKQWIKKVIDCR